MDEGTSRIPHGLFLEIENIKCLPVPAYGTYIRVSSKNSKLATPANSLLVNLARHFINGKPATQIPRPP